MLRTRTGPGGRALCSPGQVSLVGEESLAAGGKGDGSSGGQ
jgi:hypothetical protein